MAGGQNAHFRCQRHFDDVGCKKVLCRWQQIHIYRLRKKMRRADWLDSMLSWVHLSLVRLHAPHWLIWPSSSEGSQNKMHTHTHTQSTIIKRGFFFQPDGTPGSANPSATGVPVDASVLSGFPTDTSGKSVFVHPVSLEASLKRWDDELRIVWVGGGGGGPGL